jgi:hypothetical protein
MNTDAEWNVLDEDDILGPWCTRRESSDDETFVFKELFCLVDEVRFGKGELDGWVDPVIFE